LRLEVKTPPPTEDWSSILSEILQPLRSALDYAVWDLANRNSHLVLKPRRIQFPIVEKATNWPNKSKTALQGIEPEIVALIKNLQPFNKLEDVNAVNALLLLHNLNNQDKHCSIVVMPITPQSLSHGLEMEYDSDEAAARNTPENFKWNVPLFTNNDWLGEFRTLDPIVKVKGKLDWQIEFWIETTHGRLPLFQTLESLIVSVNQVLDAMHGSRA